MLKLTPEEILAWSNIIAKLLSFSEVPKAELIGDLTAIAGKLLRDRNTLKGATIEEKLAFADITVDENELKILQILADEG
jgi:hypothetical protein